jgi:RND family efflux transporter MFP subunit
MNFGWLLVVMAACPLLAGCGPSQAQPIPGPPPPPEVEAALPVTREVTDYADFPGRTEAVNSVDIRARVTGYLEKMHFKEGALVKRGDLLFEIDPRPYQADFARTEANAVQAEAHLKRLDADYQRAMTLISKGAIGREEFDKINGDRSEAVAAVAVAKAQRDMASLNLGFTKIRAPLDGRIDRRMIDPGNLVKADDTVLASIVSLDPIYAYFDLDERSTLRAKRLMREGKIKWSPETGVPVLLGLADEEGYPKRGMINYAANRVDPDSGTWQLRALFDNHDHLLSPGLFVRMRLPIGGPYQALLISEQSIGTDQGQKFVYVVDGANQVSYRLVQVGRAYGRLRVVADGLKPTEKIVVSGLQRIRPGADVTPQLVTMPGSEESGIRNRESGKEKTEPRPEPTRSPGNK